MTQHRGFLLPICVLTVLAVGVASANDTASRFVVKGCVPAVVRSSTPVGEIDPSTPISFAICLPLRNMGSLQQVLQSNGGRPLTPQQFTDQFGPSQADYDAVIKFVTASGLTVAHTHPNRTLIDVSGSARVVQAALQVHLLQYRSASGVLFHAPSSDPSVPASLAGIISGVIGLDDSMRPRPM